MKTETKKFLTKTGLYVLSVVSFIGLSFVAQDVVEAAFAFLGGWFIAKTINDCVETMYEYDEKSDIIRSKM